MKSVKILVLTFFLAMTGYGYASGTIEASSDNNHKNPASSRADQACCMAKAECCKPGAECCKPGAPCCNAEMSCCENDKQCCKGDEGCTVKADSAKDGGCAMCSGCCTTLAEAGRSAAKTNAKGRCGSACTRTVSATK